MIYVIAGCITFLFLGCAYVYESSERNYANNNWDFPAKALAIAIFSWIIMAFCLWSAQGAPSQYPIRKDAIIIGAAGPYVWAVEDGVPYTFLSPPMAEKYARSKALHPEAGGFMMHGKGGKENDGEQDELQPYSPKEMEKD